MAKRAKRDAQNEFRIWFSGRHPGRDRAVADRLLAYAALVILDNERLGLVSPNDVERFHERHLQECLAPHLLDRLPEGGQVLDVGSGGGLPGIPVAIARPDLRVRLVEPKQKKAGFLERVVLELGLGNVRVLPVRFEDSVPALGERSCAAALSRGIRWTPGMLRVAERILGPAGLIIRFGSPDCPVPGVEVAALDGPGPKAIQFWPPRSWSGLPEAP